MDATTWIMETFFPAEQEDRDLRQLSDENDRLKRELAAHQAAYASEIGYYHREIKRLHGEIGQIVKGMQVTG
jgi:hypothetical protein